MTEVSVANASLAFAQARKPKTSYSSQTTGSFDASDYSRNQSNYPTYGSSKDVQPFAKKFENEDSKIQNPKLTDTDEFFGKNDPICGRLDTDKRLRGRRCLLQLGCLAVMLVVLVGLLVYIVKQVPVSNQNPPTSS